MIGIADFDWPKSGSTILPGAICEHLTSLGGIIAERGGQTPCTEFIRAGAAGTSGTVTEPYALQEKFPTAFMHLHYARGSTLAESFYQSLYGPYQLLIIGDPLCRPWGKAARVSAPGLAAGAVLSGTQEFRPTSTGSGSPVSTFEMYADGRFVGSAAPGTPLKLDTSNLPDGHHDLAIVAVESSVLEARSRVSVPVVVKNRGRELTLTRKPPARTEYGKKFTVEVACPSAASIELLHLGRAVGRCDGPGGTIEVDTASLGTGRVALHPVAHDTSGKATDDVLGAPMEILVAPPPARAPRPAPGKTQPGLALRIAGGPPIAVSDTMPGDWLAKTGIQPGQPFELSGSFEAPEADLYQVQLRTNTSAKVEIDSAELLAAEDGSWRFAPVSLRPGPHRLRITGTAPANPSLDIRIGSKGAYHRPPSVSSIPHAEPRPSVAARPRPVGRSPQTYRPEAVGKLPTGQSWPHQAAANVAERPTDSHPWTGANRSRVAHVLHLQPFPAPPDPEDLYDHALPPPHRPPYVHRRPRARAGCQPSPRSGTD